MLEFLNFRPRKRRRKIKILSGEIKLVRDLAVYMLISMQLRKVSVKLRRF